MIAPRNFDCAQVADLLDDYRRNEIEPHLRVLISEHLAGCEACADELRMRETLAESMRATLPPSSAPTHLPPKVRRAIVAQPKPHLAGNRSARLLPWMLAAAVLITVGVAALQVSTDTPTPLQRSTRIAAVAHDSETARKPMARRAEIEPATQPAVAVAPTANNEPLPPPASAKSAAAPATMQTRMAQPRAPQGFSAADQGFAPRQEHTKPSVQEGFAPATELFQKAQKSESPATAARELMGSTRPIMYDRATTTSVSQTTTPSATLTTSTMDAPGTTAPL